MVTDRIRAAERLGYLPKNGPLYPEMTPLGLLHFFGTARGLTGHRLAKAFSKKAFASCLVPRMMAFLTLWAGMEIV